MHLRVGPNVNIIFYEIYKNTETKPGGGVNIDKDRRSKPRTILTRKGWSGSLGEFGKRLLHGTEGRLVLGIFSTEGLELLFGLGKLGANGGEFLVL